MKITKQYSAEDMLDAFQAKLDELTASTNSADVFANKNISDQYLDELYDEISIELEDEVMMLNYRSSDSDITINYTWMDIPFESTCPIVDLTGDLDSDTAYVANGILYDLDNYQDTIDTTM